MSASMVYVTAASAEEALQIGRTLVEERLVACINVLHPMTSVFRWEGAIEQATEAVLIAKTRDELNEQVIARVAELHSYETPCVLCWPIVDGSPAYLEWINDECSTVDV